MTGARPLPEPDWVAIRAKSAAQQGAEWEARYGEASWEAALVAFGELGPNDFASLTPAERAHYALALLGR
jgi:predicted esterase